MTVTNASLPTARDMDAVMRGSGPFDLLFLDDGRQYDQLLVQHLMEKGIGADGLGYVSTDPHPFDWPVHDTERRYFSGVYPGYNVSERVIGHQFSGAPVNNERSLIIVAHAFERGVFFNALCCLLEYEFRRKFKHEQGTPPTLAFFGELRTPNGTVTARNVIVPVIHDLGRVPWLGYVPIEDGMLTYNQVDIIPENPNLFI